MEVFRALFTRSNFKVSTWLSLGALTQCLLATVLPPRVAALPCVALLLYRLIHTQLQIQGIASNPNARGIALGRTSAQFPAADGSTASTRSSESIVVLVLIATLTHPNGILCPGGREMGEMFTAMWHDAETQREKYGYLGNTPALVAEKAGTAYGTRSNDDQGNTLTFLSYWKTLDGLHAFAHAEAHQKGWLWWDRGANKTYPHIGIAHEIYEVPAGHWENIYHNFMPFGLANAKFPVKTREGNDARENKETTKWVSGIQHAHGKEWKSMESRMEKAPGSVGVRNSNY